MIDKADLRGPRSVAFRPAVQKLLRQIDYSNNSLRFRPSRYYRGVADLRQELGIDAILHAYCRYGPNNDHKLEIIDVGKKSFSELFAIAESIFDCDPNNLAIMRVDLCADIAGVKVSWFLTSTRVKYKRFGREIGMNLKYAKLGQGDVETIMAGVSPDMLRIYNKVAECKMQFKKLQRKASHDAEPLDFKKEFGFKESDIITRVERQHGGRGVPPLLGTLGKLANAPNYDPFAQLEIVTGAPHRPTIEECSGVNEYFAGIGMNCVLNEIGLQQLRLFLNRHSRGNTARMLQRYGPFLAPRENELTAQQLFDTYRNSVMKQLAA